MEKATRSKISSYLFLLVFPVIIFYYECILNLFTVSYLLKLSTLATLCFSFLFGVIGYLFATLFKSQKVIHILTSILVGVSCLPFLIQYFIYRQFKVFYDINTVFGGAKDALGGFSGEIFNMIFSLEGIAVILLCLVPLAFYIIFGKKLFGSASANWKSRLVVFGGAILCYALSIVIICVNPVYLSVYKNEYNYQSAVQNFGLLTGVRLDIQNLLFGNSGAKFEPTDAPVVSVPEKPKVYGYNQLDLKLDGGSGKIAELNKYVSSLTPTHKNEYTGIFKGKNLIMITAEAFTAEVIDPVLTPTLYRLATNGINFTDYYQPDSAGTTGGEYQNIFGMLPTSGGASFKNTADKYNYMTMGSQLDRLGYYGKAFHNNSYTYYSRHLTHINLGYSDGFMGYGNGMEKYVKNTWPQSDLQMFEGTLPTFIDNQPFNVYYMTVSGHSNYSRTGNYMVGKNWDVVKDLPYNDYVKGYLAANYELEKALTYLVNELEAKGIADDTVICISPDHFPYGLDKNGRLGNLPNLSELFGYNVENYFQRDHSALILWCGSLEKEEPIVVDTPTFSLDILPTLSNLFGTEFDSRLFVGRDVFSDAEPLVFNSHYDWKTEYGTYFSAKGEFVPSVDASEIPEGYVNRIKTTVRNKMRYSAGVLDTDYFRYLFENK